MKKQVIVAGMIIKRNGRVVESKTRSDKYHMISWGTSITAKVWREQNA